MGGAHAITQKPCEMLKESRSWSTGTPSRKHPDSSKDMSSATNVSGEGDDDSGEEGEISSGGVGLVIEKSASNMVWIVM